MIKETEHVRHQEQWHQGDIIALERQQDGPHPTMGVIINADCDIQNNKTDGVLAYLPIYHFSEYVNNFWAPAHLNEHAATLISSILNLSSYSEDDAENLRTWLSTAPPEDIVQKLSPTLPPRKGQIEKLSDLVTRAHICLNTAKNPLQKLQCLCRLDTDPSASMKKKLKNAKQAMGDGHFFISELVEHENVCFVVRMRRIYTIPQSRCFTSTAVQRASTDGSDVTAVRFARFSPLYQFKLAQLFAQQYSRIGLPNSLTDMEDIAVDMLASALLQEQR